MSGKCAGVALLMLVALAVVRNSDAVPETSASGADSPPASTEPCGATLAEFHGLEIGRSDAAARDIIGCGCPGQMAATSLRIQRLRGGLVNRKQAAFREDAQLLQDWHRD